MWTTVPQFVYYRLKAWNAVSTPLRASNLLLRKYLAKTICTPLCFRTTLITNAASPWEREGFSKTDSTQYCNSRNTQNREEAQLLATPTNAPNSTKWKHWRLFKIIRRKQGMQTEDKKSRTSRRMRQEETQK